ncbi:MAG: SDR family oxidoreductase [Mogibacterium sp.]|nr:SDR family oxidoreductase [Mogibacterium sp.]
MGHLIYLQILIRNSAYPAEETLDSDFFQANAKTMIPMERYGNEGELDTAAVFLASPKTSYVTGIMVPVDGGYTCM